MNKHMKKVLQIIWGLEVVLVCFVMIICAMTLLDWYSFPYYGYTQWPWIYDNKLVYLRYVLSEILVCIFGIGYSYRYIKQNLIKALFIMSVSATFTLYLFIL